MKSLRLLIPITLSGLMLALAWLGFSGLILLIAFIPLLYCEELVRQEYQQKTILFWVISFLTFLIWNALSTYWIWYATPAGALFVIIINSLLMSLVWWFFHLVSIQKGSLFGQLFLFFLWISFEYLHFNWEISWPWLTLGNGLANDVKLIQWYEYTGVFGGTAWILGTNLLIWNLIKRGEGISLKNLSVKLMLALIIVIIPIVFSLIRYHYYSEKSDPVEVVIAQPNIDPYHDKFNGMEPDEQLNRLLRVSDSLGTSSTDFFIGPETALSSIWENAPENNRQLSTVKRFINEKYPTAAYVVGATTFLRYFSSETSSPTARFSADSSIIYDAYNAACFIERDTPTEFYHKIKLVSGVEKMPFEKHLHFLKKMVVNLGGISGTLGTLNDTVVFQHNNAIVAVPVCFESVYGEYFTRFIKKGANIFFLITNDGWCKDTPGYRQHLSYSCLRAIELRRSIARSANTGISCLINQRGEIIQKSRWWSMTSLSGNINLNDKITFYARFGDYIARVSVLALVILSFFVFISAKLFRKGTN